MRPCKLVPLHTPLVEVVPAVMVVSDVLLDSALSVEMLRAAYAHYAKVPMLCLLRDDRHRTHMQALAIPATATLPADAPRAVLIKMVLNLIESGRDLNGKAPYDAVKACATQAGVALADMMDDAASDRAVSPQTLATGADLVLEAVEQGDTHIWLDVLRDYDDVTYQHCLMVTGLAASFATRLGFSLGDRRRLAQAALLHDIGKARIPLQILNKPGRLTSREMALMRTHPVVGHDILVRQGGFEREQLSVVRHHHEYLDGSGYPDGLAAGQIADLVRLVTICDVYAALIEKRPYKDPMPRDQAYFMMAQMGEKLDADLFAVFRKVAVPFTSSSDSGAQ